MEWKLNHVATVVRDLDKAIEHYSSVLGIGPFRKREAQFSRLEVRGKPCQLTLKLAFADLGQTSFELIQAEPGESIYWEFFQRQGEGLHHLGFAVEDLDAELARLGGKGVQVLQSGTTERGRHAYLESADFGGTLLELVERKGT